MIITLQLRKNIVHITMSREGELEYCDRVKVYGGQAGSYLVLDEENKWKQGTVTLAHGATMHIDAYGEKGEGHLLSQDYRREGTSLVLVKTHVNDGITIVIEQEQPS